MKSKIDELKLNHHIMSPTSEDLFGIENPPEFQCDKVDYIVDVIEKALDEINDAQSYMKNEEYDEANECISDIEYYISGNEDKMEDLRVAIESLREWGQQWKDLAKEMINDQDNVIDVEGKYLA